MALLQQLEAYQRVQNRINQLQLQGRDQEAHQLIETLERITIQKEEKAPKPEKDNNPEIQEIAQLLKDTIQELKTLTEIKATISIHYEKIKNEAVRKRLVIDNLRMEQAYCNIHMSDTERFHSFCTNAFYQVENLLNYYYFIRFPDFKDCLKYFKDKGTKFEGKHEPQKLSKVASHSKLNCFEQEFYYDQSGNNDFHDSQLDLIREVRNLESHRCDVFVQEYEKIRIAYSNLLNAIKNAKDRGLTYTKSNQDIKTEKEGKLAFFIKEHNFELVRQEVLTLYDKVISNLK